MGSAVSLRKLAKVFCAVLCAVFCVALSAPSAFAQTVDPATKDLLAEFDITVTGGAAAGYVPDATCAMCHSDKAESFKQVGMGKSFHKPDRATVIEDFENNHYYHAPSDRHYEMELRGEDYWFIRYQIAPDGVQINRFEQKVDWVLGSGHHSRVYLYRTNDGLMYQLPLAWYTQDSKWAMAPGFEFFDQTGVLREVKRRCMACHNAFPDVPSGSDDEGQPDTFPVDLPQGIGCQRCHGPGANHVAKAISGDAGLDEIHAAIVQPAKLPRDQLYGICYGCHMQPSVAIPSPLRMGRGIYSFRPGELVSDYKVFLDIEDTTRTKKDRFDINHHPYRLEQSECFLQSEGQLGCLNCHDPHVKLPVEQRAEHYRNACLSCHETTAAGLPVLRAAEKTHPALGDNPDCTSCHMPERRTQDVIEVTMTDHRIQIPRPQDDPTARIAKEPAIVGGVSIYDKTLNLSPSEALIYKTMGILDYAGGRDVAASDALRRTLNAQPVPQATPWAKLSKSLLQRDMPAQALQAGEQALRYSPTHPEVLGLMGAAQIKLGNIDAAQGLFRRVADEGPGQADKRFNLALLLAYLKDYDGALAQAHQALEERHTLWPAWRLVGDLQKEKGALELSAQAYKQALAIEPRAPQLRQKLAEVLQTLGRGTEAKRYLP